VCVCMMAVSSRASFLGGAAARACIKCKRPAQRPHEKFCTACGGRMEAAPQAEAAPAESNGMLRAISYHYRYCTACVCVLTRVCLPSP
jgi:hypothetical protein